MRKSNYYLGAARLGAAAVIAALLLAVCQTTPRVGGPDDGEKRRTVRTVVIVKSVLRGEAPADTIEIRSEADLINFADAILGDEPDPDGKLMNDITLTALSKDYIPLGKAKNNNKLPPEVHEYTGTFNGNGKTISGLDVVENTSYAALFAFNNGVIKNLTVEGTVTANVGANDVDYVAGVVAYNGIGHDSNSGIIQNVISRVTVNAAKDTTHNIGGIAGFNGYDHYNPDSPYVDDPDYPNDYEEGGTILQCRNGGAVTGGFNKIGGIAGENAYRITQCVNTGTITCNKTGTGWPGVGGIAGRNGNNNTATEQGNILSSYNRGLVVDSTSMGSAHNAYGGITGWSNTLSKVTNCYTTGEFQPESGSKNPIIATADDTTGIGSNNYSLDSIFASSKDEVLTGTRETDAYMKTEDFVNDLNAQGSAYDFVSGDYPKLDWE
ncbi:MAG: hypothetical protein LBJ86_07665 [Spirochaetaceae bacterium]|jgi:hypothetical protein|nr:hypothetical protein [Spirochaetaceae bacterium]